MDSLKELREWFLEDPENWSGSFGTNCCRVFLLEIYRRREMKISIEQLLVVRQRDFLILNRAFSEALGDNYRNPDYVLTRQDASGVFESIERQAAEVENDNEFFPRTAEQKMVDAREVNQAAEAFRDLYNNVFKL